MQPLLRILLACFALAVTLQSSWGQHEALQNRNRPVSSDPQTPSQLTSVSANLSWFHREASGIHRVVSKRRNREKPGAPASPRTSDQVSVTLRLSDPLYEVDANWFQEVKRFLENARELRQWQQRAVAASAKIRRRKLAEKNREDPSLYPPFATTEEIEAEIGPRPEALPMPEVLNLGLVLEIQNVSEHPVSVNIGLYSDLAWVSTTIRGRGAQKHQSPPRITTMEIRQGHPVAIAPGQSRSVPMGMTDGRRGFGGPWLFTEPGDYEVNMVIYTRVDGSRVELQTNQVPFSIIAKPQQDERECDLERR
jgi:hypothetical protein